MLLKRQCRITEMCLHVRISEGGVSGQVEQVEDVVGRMTVVDQLEVHQHQIRRLKTSVV